ncbi:MAG: DNA polymerase III subunit delta [Patescibacteria group bacterium]|nr:DNA polymerase III subunit delta [Patescibacteria group bacterium]
MIIILYGEDTFRLRQKLIEVIEEYQAKHKTGLNLMRFKENNFDFDKVRERIESISMFNEKKLITLENALDDKSFSEEFLKYIKKNKLKDNPEVIVVFYQESKSVNLPFIRQASMFEEFKPLLGNDLINWLKKQASKNKVNINPEVLRKLVAYVGNDLWQLNNELNKLGSYRAGQVVDEQDIDLLIKSKIDADIFKTLDALAKRDKKTAFRLLHEHLEQGESEIYLFSMFIYQIRVLLKLKDLIEKGTSFYDLPKLSGLHPFVVKKSSEQLNNFKLEQLKNIYKFLLKIELGLKKGRLDGSAALDLLVAEI